MSLQIIVIIAIIMCAFGAAIVLFDAWNDARLIYEVKNNPYHPARKNPLPVQNYVPVGIESDGTIVMGSEGAVDIRV